MANLTEGAIAPDFTLLRDGGGTVALGDFKGKSVVLFFYPKDDTSGCTHRINRVQRTSERIFASGHCGHRHVARFGEEARQVRQEV